MVTKGFWQWTCRTITLLKVIWWKRKMVMLFLKKNKTGTYITFHSQPPSKHLCWMMRIWSQLPSWVWIMYTEWKHKPHHFISFHSVHNINYFHFTMEQQMSDGSKSHPECSTSELVNTISVLFYQLQWEKRGKFCINRNIEQSMNLLKPSGFFTYHQV